MKSLWERGLAPVNARMILESSAADIRACTGTAPPGNLFGAAPWRPAHKGGSPGRVATVSAL